MNENIQFTFLGYVMHYADSFNTFLFLKILQDRKIEIIWAKLGPGIMRCNLGNHADGYCIIAPSFRNIKPRSYSRERSVRKSGLDLLNAKWRGSKAEIQYFPHWPPPLYWNGLIWSNEGVKTLPRIGKSNLWTLRSNFVPRSFAQATNWITITIDTPQPYSAKLEGGN